jgi:hypothetical protein
MLESASNETCQPPLEKKELQQIARSVERADRRNGFSTSGGQLKLFSIDDVMNESSPEWRVEGLLQVGTLSMIYAPQEQYKTFFGLDLALCVAHGLDFHGRPVKQGPTVYILGEGRGGLKNRIQAWLRENGVEDKGNAFFSLEAVQFRRFEDVQPLVNEIEAKNIKPAMVFIDTFARSAVGVDENDARDVGQWIHSVTRLQHQLDVDVVVLHHAQKSGGDFGTPRERGSSAFIGAVDTVIRLTATDKQVKVTCEKQKDAERFDPFTLAVKVLSLGANERGELASSCVLVDPEDPDVAIDPLADEHRVMLSTLKESPGSTAKRQDWFPKTGFSERSFDRYRNELVTRKYIKAVGPSDASSAASRTITLRPLTPYFERGYGW